MQKKQVPSIKFSFNFLNALETTKNLRTLMKRAFRFDIDILFYSLPASFLFCYTLSKILIS